jgi:PKHD-type hydroxylase
MVRNHWWFWESVISKKDCMKFIEEHFLETEKISATYMLEEKHLFNTDIRKTEICWVNTDTDLAAALFFYMAEANKNAGWNFDLSGIERVQLGKYDKEGHYNWHKDIDPPDEHGFQRKLSVSLILSDPQDYEGGELEFSEDRSNSVKAPSKQGSIIVFPSFIQHRVAPVVSGTRYSAVGWMRGKAFK